MNIFYKLLHFILFTLSLCLTINAAAQNQCEQSLSSTQSRKLTESESVKGPPPKEPLANSKNRTLIEAYNKGFFTETQRYIYVFNLGYNPTRIKSFDEKNLVLEMIDIDGNITEEILPLRYLSDAVISPSTMNYFKSLESTLAEAEPVEYPQFNKEAQMLEKGIKKEMSQGLDEAYKMNYFADYLRTSKVNPYKTHIEDFSNQIPEYIRFIREGIKGHKDVAEILKLLDKLTLEASKKQKEKGVTYAWWLEWNMASTRLLSGFDTVYKKDEDDIKSLIEQFPDFVALPNFEDLGIMAINKLTSENVFPLGLVNKDVPVHNSMHDPVRFFRHDMNHASYIMRFYILNDSILPYGEVSFTANKEFYEKIQNLPTAQQMQAEMVYFISTHESDKYYYRSVPENNFGS